jgi:hypothetical protein
LLIDSLAAVAAEEADMLLIAARTDRKQLLPAHLG